MLTEYCSPLFLVIPPVFPTTFQQQHLMKQRQNLVCCSHGSTKYPIFCAESFAKFFQFRDDLKTGSHYPSFPPLLLSQRTISSTKLIYFRLLLLSLLTAVSHISNWKQLKFLLFSKTLVYPEHYTTTGFFKKIYLRFFSFFLVERRGLLKLSSSFLFEGGGGGGPFFIVNLPFPT